VARRGSVSRAAETLFVTQPSLTARLLALEKELGEPLFVRTRQGMRLTDAGRGFLPYAERAMRALRDGRQALEEVRSGVAGHLLLAAAPAVSTYLLPSILETFAERHPRVEVAVRTGHSEDVQVMVLRDEVQLGLGRALLHPDIELKPFYEDHLVLAVHPHHPFTRDESVQMEDVGRERLILFDITSSYRELTEAAFLSAGVVPRFVMELDNIESAKKMVQRKLGIALLPSSSVRQEQSDGTLGIVPVADLPQVPTRIVSMRRRDAGPPAGAVRAFLDLLSHRPVL
jgi:DNA-binding transcriptional LysR family regulator